MTIIENPLKMRVFSKSALLFRKIFTKIRKGSQIQIEPL